MLPEGRMGETPLADEDDERRCQSEAETARMRAQNRADARFVAVQGLVPLVHSARMNGRGHVVPRIVQCRQTVWQATLCCLRGAFGLRATPFSKTEGRLPPAAPKCFFLVQARTAP